MAREERMHIMKELQTRGSTHTCQSCSKPTYCAMEDGKSGNLCWCMSVDSQVTYHGSDQCVCKTCLTAV